MKCDECGETEAIVVEPLNGNPFRPFLDEFLDEGTPGDRLEYHIACWECGWGEERFLELGRISPE